MAEPVSDLKYWVAFNRIRRLGPIRLRQIEARFGDLSIAWKAGQSDLASVGLDRSTVREIVSGRPEIDPDSEMEALESAGIGVICLRSPEYPARLAEIYDPPPVLYIRGKLVPGDERSVAVVGTRASSGYGREMATRLAGDLAANGVTVVSGLAAGIDAAAHRAALDVGGRTIAGVGSGLDQVYPAAHADLARKIAESGAVLSEYPPGVKPHARNFPRRNRILSGMTLGTLVVEAGYRSGALLTVTHALEQNREVFAVPGSALSDRSSGANWLIQQGAKLVIDVQDILEELNIAGLGVQLGLSAPAPVTGTVESELLNMLRGEPVHVDEITRRTGKPISVVSASLTMLELNGLVRQAGSMMYIAVPGQHRNSPSDNSIESREDS
ncbi:MAG: DNA-processing protein DprA [Dehalococcoidia bacterium]|jgi:DNA processing protein|nr:DNA-processing protein DprA [Dehalococcoidia bacterium]